MICVSEWDMAPYIEAIDSQQLFYFIVSVQRPTTYIKFFISTFHLLGMVVVSGVSMFSYSLQFRSFFILSIKIVRCSVLNENQFVPRKKTPIVSK